MAAETAISRPPIFAPRAPRLSTRSERRPSPASRPLPERPVPENRLAASLKDSLDRGGGRLCARRTAGRPADRARRRQPARDRRCNGRRSLLIVAVVFVGAPAPQPLRLEDRSTGDRLDRPLLQFGEDHAGRLDPVASSPRSSSASISWPSTSALLLVRLAIVGLIGVVGLEADRLGDARPALCADRRRSCS